MISSQHGRLHKGSSMNGQFYAIGSSLSIELSQSSLAKLCCITEPSGGYKF